MRIDEASGTPLAVDDASLLRRHVRRARVLSGGGFLRQRPDVPCPPVGYDVYDISKRCEGPLGSQDYYPHSNQIQWHLNLNSTREVLGVDGRVERFFMSSEALQRPARVVLTRSGCFELTTPVTRRGDMIAPNAYYVAGLLERSISVLIYAGTYD